MCSVQYRQTGSTYSNRALEVRVVCVEPSLCLYHHNKPEEASSNKDHQQVEHRPINSSGYWLHEGAGACSQVVDHELLAIQ